MYLYFDPMPFGSQPLILNEGVITLIRDFLPELLPIFLELDSIQAQVASLIKFVAWGRDDFNLPVRRTRLLLFLSDP